MKQKTSIPLILSYLLSVVTVLVFMQNCSKCTSSQPTCRPKHKSGCHSTVKTCKKQPSPKESNYQSELDFDVKNETGKTLYVTCFVYLKKIDFGHWKWEKSPVYKLDDKQTTTINLERVPDEQDRNHVFGYLGVFNYEQSAQNAIYELADDRNLLDLDLLIQLNGKTVTLTIEKYGFKGEFFEYDFENKDISNKRPVPSLDFPVENKTGKPILVTCFPYEKKAKGRWIAALEEKDDMAVWRFDKTPVIKLMPNEIALIKLDPILGNRDRAYVRGFLGVFDEDQERLAQQSTLELLDAQYKLSLGELPRLKNKKIVIEIEKYGMLQDFVDFVIKPANEIDFIKLKRK